MSSSTEIGIHLERLAGAFGKPWGAKTAEAMIRGWYTSSTLKALPEPALAWAVERFIETGEKFPYPKQIIALALRAPMLGANAARPKDQPPEDRRCSECLEWWGYHRIVVKRERLPIALLVRDLVRHTQACSLAKRQETFLRFYGYSWVDSAPDVGVLEEGEPAHRVDGVQQLIDPLPPTVFEHEAERRRERDEKRHKSQHPHRALLPAVSSAAIADVVPAAAAATARGDYLPPEEDLR